MTDLQPQFDALLDELERWNQKVNLTALSGRQAMQTGHIDDSLTALPLLHGQRVLDVGTGGGFPGLPLAIAAPDREFVLIDGNNKKIQFVRHAAGLLGLKNVQAVHVRAEDYAPAARFDTVIARAVASLATLLDVAGHHVGEDGVFVALKGRYPYDELNELNTLQEQQQLPKRWRYEVRELEVAGLDKGSRHAVVLKPDDE
ncbi:MAG: 16S rRNA (guanine(527)-N(7))-methyltransferase RsmG [Pseudomonadota bacterium]